MFEDAPAFVNAEGIDHLYSEGLPEAEAEELSRLAEGMTWCGWESGKYEHPMFNPVVSERQRRAMYAAAEGRSTLGIPKKVAREFLKK